MTAKFAARLMAAALVVLALTDGAHCQGGTLIQMSAQETVPKLDVTHTEFVLSPPSPFEVKASGSPPVTLLICTPQMKDCKLTEGHTIDEVMTVMMNIMNQSNSYALQQYNLDLQLHEGYRREIAALKHVIALREKQVKILRQGLVDVQSVLVSKVKK